jgi:hypothetical protein
MSIDTKKHMCKSRETIHLNPRPLIFVIVVGMRSGVPNVLASNLVANSRRKENKVALTLR